MCWFYWILAVVAVFFFLRACWRLYAKIVAAVYKAEDEELDERDAAIEVSVEVTPREPEGIPAVPEAAEAPVAEDPTPAEAGPAIDVTVEQPTEVNDVVGITYPFATGCTYQGADNVARPVFLSENGKFYVMKTTANGREYKSYISKGLQFESLRAEMIRQHPETEAIF